jgi:hypothetical protein
VFDRYFPENKESVCIISMRPESITNDKMQAFEQNWKLEIFCSYYELDSIPILEENSYKTSDDINKSDLLFLHETMF